MPARRWPFCLGALAGLAALAASCGSSGGSSPSSSPAATKSCQEVSAALADGPDPGVDPVGYALAQIHPLDAMKVSSDPTLQKAIDHLASAYQTFYSDHGGHAATQAVSQAGKTINALCPGAGAGT
jgi:hypothetical protein